VVRHGASLESRVFIMNYSKLKREIRGEVGSIIDRYWKSHRVNQPKSGRARRGSDLDLSRQLRRRERRAALQFAVASNGQEFAQRGHESIGPRS
jgi:hypothetical protein